MDSAINFIFICLLFLYKNRITFCDQEERITMDLIQVFDIRHCIFLENCKNKNLRNIKKFSSKGLSVTTLKLDHLTTYANKMPVYVKTMIIHKANNNYEFGRYFKNISETYKMNLFIWLMFTEESVLNEMRYKSGLPIPIDCEFIIATQTNDSTYKLTETYKFKNDIHYFKYGTWDANNHLKTTTIPFNVRRSNLNNTVLMMAPLLKFTEILCIPGPTTKQVLPPCLFFELLGDVGKALSYSTKVIESEENLNDIKLDVVSLFSTFHHYTNNTDRIMPILITKLHMYIKTIRDDQKFLKAYLHPFDKWLWTAIGYWILISSSATAMIAYVTFRVLRLQGFTLLDQVLMPIAALCNQCMPGFNKQPQVISIRIATISSFLVTVVIFQVYSATIISFLTVDDRKLPFTDFETFVEDKTYKMASTFHPLMFAFFDNSNDKTVQIIRDKYLLNYTEFPRDVEGCIDLICKNDKLSVIVHNYRMFQLRSPCSITLIPHELTRFHTGFELANDALQCRKLFFEAILKFHSCGVINKVQRVLYGKQDFKADNKELRSIGINVVLSLIAVLLLGTITSALMFLLEIILHNLKRSRLIGRTKTKFY